LKYNRFIEAVNPDDNVKLTVSAVGKMWLRRYEFALRKVVNI